MRKKERKQQIIDAGVALCNIKKIDDITLKDVAKLTKTTPQNVIYHFKSIKNLHRAIKDHL